MCITLEPSWQECKTPTMHEAHVTRAYGIVEAASELTRRETVITAMHAHQFTSAGQVSIPLCLCRGCTPLYHVCRAHQGARSVRIPEVQQTSLYYHIVVAALMLHVVVHVILIHGELIHHVVKIQVEIMWRPMLVQHRPGPGFPHDRALQRGDGLLEVADGHGVRPLQAPTRKLSPGTPTLPQSRVHQLHAMVHDSARPP